MTGRLNLKVVGLLEVWGVVDVGVGVNVGDGGSSLTTLWLMVSCVSDSAFRLRDDGDGFAVRALCMEVVKTENSSTLLALPPYLADR